MRGTTKKKGSMIIHYNPLLLLCFVLAIGAIIAIIVICTRPAQPVSYSSSATAGDFWTVDMSSATELKWANLTSDTQGTAVFATDETGLMSFDSNTGGLTSGVEIPGYAIVLGSTNAGLNSDQNAVIMGMIFQEFQVSALGGNIYTYFQFRTQNGGAECGAVYFDVADGGTTNVIHQGYFPYNSLFGSGEIFSDNRNLPIVLRESDVSADKRFATVQDGDFDVRVFKSTFGFCVDLQQGSLFALPAAESSAFNSAYAGTYNAILYRKVVTGTSENKEVGTSEVKAHTIIITASGSISISGLWNDSSLTAWVDSGSSKYGSDDWLKTNAIAAECRGMFFAEATEAELFVAFVNSDKGTGCILNSVHNSENNQYEYFFGMGLKS